METPDLLHPITEKLLNKQYYFQSLVEQARLCGLLSDRDISEMQAELLSILAEQSDKWSWGESSSVPAEKAQDIMTSVMFVIGMQLKSYPSPEQAVDILKSEPLKIIFDNGMKLVRRKMAIARRLQKRITNKFLNTQNVYYRSTIADGINGFFKLYSPQFSAHEIHITADYPVYMGRPKLDGIEFIERYLRCIEAENTFCVCFAPQDIHHLLCGLTRDYRSVPMNLFEPVFLSAIGLVISERGPERLDLSEDDIPLLYQKFSGRSENEIRVILKKAFYRLDKIMRLPHTSKLYAYLSIPRLAAEIGKAVTFGTLDKIFLVPAYPEQEPENVFSYGERMNDKKYKKLVEKILQADSCEEKTSLILQQVRSLADLLDILSDTELNAEEHELLVDMLPPSAFIALLAQYPNDDFLNRESERLLFNALRERKTRLSPAEMRCVERALQKPWN